MPPTHGYEKRTNPTSSVLSPQSFALRSVAGLGLALLALDAEGVAAAAGGGGIRVLHREAAAEQRVHVVHLRARDHLQRLVVNQHLHAVHVADVVAGALLIVEE